MWVDLCIGYVFLITVIKLFEEMHCLHFNIRSICQCIRSVISGLKKIIDILRNRILI